MYEISSQTVKLSYTQRVDHLNPEIFSTMGFFLELHGLHLLYSPFRTIITEITNNAFKANLKRLFFKVNKLDLVADYKKGQKQFSRLFHSDSSQIVALSGANNLNVHIIFTSKKKNLVIKVRNDAPILENELKSVQSILKHPIESGKKRLKEKEGGGLGLQMVLLMLTNLGLKNSWDFKTQKNYTEFSIIVPTATDFRSLSVAKKRMISQSLPNLLAVHSNSIDKYTDRFSYKLNKMKQDPKILSINNVPAHKNNSRPDLKYPESADLHLLEMNKIRASMFKDLPIDVSSEKKQLIHNLLEVFLLSERTCFVLSDTAIASIREITGRNQAIHKSYFPAATLGLAPGTIIQLWANMSLSEIQIKNLFTNFSESSEFILARILYLYWNTKKMKSKKELNWSLYSKYLYETRNLTPNIKSILNKITKMR